MTNRIRPLSKEKKFQSNFLAQDESNIQSLLDKIYDLYSEFDNSEFAKRPIKRFRYQDKINDDFFTDSGLNRKKLLCELKQFFDGTLNWHNPYTAFNITSTPLLDTVAASTVATLMNPNCLWDFTSGKFILAEKKIIHLLAKKILHTNNADGLSTFGGKGTLLYAIKSGLSNCDFEHKKEGLNGNYVVICDYSSHFCINDVCDYVGIGTKGLLRVPLLPTGEMNYDKLEEALEKSINEGKKIATIICNGGTTIDFCIDNAKKVRAITDKIEKKYKLPYHIHIHGDMVFGWTWFLANEKRLRQSNADAAKKILKIQSKLKNMKCADSIGIDFHKMGLCPYNSSFFIMKDKKRMNLLGSNASLANDDLWGTKHPHYHSIENSKSGAGIISAYAALSVLGSNGIADYLLYLMQIKETLVNLINTKFNHIFTIINQKSLGFEIVMTATVDGQKLTPDEYIQLCDKIWYSEKSPYITSLVSRYFRNGKSEPALLVYSLSPHMTETHCLNLLKMLEADCKKIAKQKHKQKNACAFIPR